jgi:hypothetical protein
MTAEPGKIVPSSIEFKHDWKTLSEQRIAECDDGNSRTLRTCFHCGLVKVTVHSPDGRAWRMWRSSPDSTIETEWVGHYTPTCSGPREIAEPVKLDEAR